MIRGGETMIREGGDFVDCHGDAPFGNYILLEIHPLN